MKVRTTRAGTALGARLTAICWGALALLALATVSACSGGSSSTPNIPTPSPSVTISGTAPASDGNTPSSGTTTTTSPGTPGVTSSTPAPTGSQVTPTVTETVTAPATSTTTVIPNAAPVTGGGGTAGLQDGLLFALGAALILAGVGSIVYRRRLPKDR
jgi:hypothetical protein